MSSTSGMPMLCAAGTGETDAAGPANSAAAAAALERRTDEQPGRLAMLPSLGSLHSLSNPSFSSSGSIHILDSACGVPLQAVGENSEVVMGADSRVDESAQSMAGPSITVPRPNSTAAATLKLQPSSTSMEQRRSDMDLLRTRRRQWLEDQARQIEMEEHGQHRLGEAGGEPDCPGLVQPPSEVAEAAAQTAARYFGSLLPMSASGGGGGSSAGTETGPRTEMDSAGHFRHRSISITGINLPSPLSQRFILNMPLPTEGSDGTCHQKNAADMNEGQGQAWPQTKDERRPLDESDVHYAIRGGADVCMDANLKEEDDGDDESTVVMDCGDVDNNDSFSEKGIVNASAPIEDRPRDVPHVVNQYPAINLRRRSDDGLPADDQYPISRDQIGIPSTRSSDSLFDSMYRRSSDGGPGVANDLGEDFVMPCRPRSSEPRFATHFQGHGLKPKIASEAASTFKPAALKASARTIGRTALGPAPPPPPIYGQADFADRTKRSQNKPSSQHLATLKQPLLSDSANGTSKKDAEKEDKQPKRVSSDMQMEAMIGLITVDGENEGVEVSLPAHLSADGFDSLKGDGPCSVSPVAAEVLPSRRPRPANVSTFDRSNSVVDEARGDPFGGSAEVATATGGTAFFTPPHAKARVRFSKSKGEENAPPSSQNCGMGGGSPPLAQPVGWPGHPLPLQKHANISSFGRSSSVGGVYTSPEQIASNSHQYCTPGETASQRKPSEDGTGAKSFQSAVVRSQPQCGKQLHGDFRPRLPSLASPMAMEEDD